MRSRQGFIWHREIERGREKIRRCYEEIIGKHPADADRVIIGGFSTGGTMVLDVVLSEAIPAAGFKGLIGPARSRGGASRLYGRLRLRSTGTARSSLRPSLR